MDNKIHPLPFKQWLEYKPRSKRLNKRSVQHWNQNEIKDKGLINKTNEKNTNYFMLI
jgi:hypothetical protein